MKTQAGYSVFEVLIAFAIMSLVLSALLPGQARLLGRASNEEDTVLAYDFALSRLASMAVETPLFEGIQIVDHAQWQTQEAVRIGQSKSGVAIAELSVTVLDAGGQEIARAVSVRAHRDE